MTTSFQVGRIPEWTTGDRMRKAREQTGMDQSEFAEAVGLSRTAVGKVERSQSEPRRSTLRLWALVTGVPLRWLETGEAPPPSGGDGAEVRQQGFEPRTFCSVSSLDEFTGQLVAS